MKQKPVLLGTKRREQFKFNWTIIEMWWIQNGEIKIWKQSFNFDNKKPVEVLKIQDLLI